MARSRNGSPEPDAQTLAALPCVVLEAVIKRLPLADAARAACACKSLSSAAAAAAAHLTRLEESAAWGVEQPSAEAVGYAARHCSRLELVWLGAGANDEHLFALRRAPALKEVLLCGAEGVTDAGVAALLAEVPCLACIDAVECAHVTHESVVAAGAAGGRVLVRRLPAWFARPWRCVQHRNIPAGELHQYFPDGTFRFSRFDQNAGCVVSWRAAPPQPGEEQPPGHHQLVVRFDDEGALAVIGLPGWRPGINVRAEGPRHMRSAQRRSHHDTSAPETLPLVDAPNVACGYWEAVEDGEDDAALHDVAPAGADD